MKCPSCNVDLQMSERQGVEIDYCSQCRGVWLDRGELDKIIEKAALSEQQNSPAQEIIRNTRNHRNDGYDDDESHWERRDGERRRGSFLSDLFDF